MIRYVSLNHSNSVDEAHEDLHMLTQATMCCDGRLAYYRVMKGAKIESLVK